MYYTENKSAVENGKLTCTKDFIMIILQGLIQDSQTEKYNGKEQQ